MGHLKAITVPKIYPGIMTQDMQEETFNVSTYRYNSEIDKQSFALGMINFKSAGTYPITNESDAAVRYFSLKDSCEVKSEDKLVYCLGSLTITKFDTSNGIISGTFYLTMYNSSCKDTLKFTEGRFDLGQ